MLKNSKNKRLLTNYDRFVKRRLIRNNVSTIPPRRVPIVTHVSRHSPLMISSSNTPLVPSSSTPLQPSSNTLVPSSSNPLVPNYCLDPYRYDPRREVHPIPPNLHMSSNHFNPHVLKPNSYHTQHVNRYQPQYVNHYNSQYVNYNHQQYQHRPRSEHSFGHYPSSHNPSPYNFHQHQVSPHHHPYNVPEHGQQYQHLINPQPHIHYNQFSQKKNYVSGIATLQMNEEHCKAVKDFLIPKNLVLAKVLDENKGVHIHTREEGSKYILSSKELAIFQHLVDKLHQYVPPKTWRWCEEEENELLEKLKIIKYGKTYRVDLRRKYIIYILIRKNQSKNIKYHFPSQKLNHTREVEIREQRMRENPRDIQLRLEQEKFQQEQELHMRQQFLQVETNNTMMKKSEINSNNTQTNSSNSSQNIEEGQEIRREKREIRGRDRSTIEELRELKKLINANASKEYLYLKFPEWMEWTIASCNNVGLIENVDDYIKAVWIPKVQK